MNKSAQATRIKIIDTTTKLFAIHGYDGITMRNIAKLVKIAPSVLYYYFEDKDILLRTVFEENNTQLGLLRKALPKTKTASDMLYQRIDFQLQHAEKIVSVLKYFLTYRKQFNQLPTGFVPDKAYLHIEESLLFGVKTGEFANKEIREQAKIITHAINGFVLEYYPDIPKKNERNELIENIHKFILRGIYKNE